MLYELQTMSDINLKKLKSHKVTAFLRDMQEKSQKLFKYLRFLPFYSICGGIFAILDEK